MTDTVHMVDPARLYPFPNNPFQMRELDELAVSIADAGVIAPLIVREFGEGLQIIDGHRRALAAQLAEVTTVPVLVRTLDDDSAVIALVDSNLHRDTLKPSERAFAYKMKLDAIRHQGRACGHSVHKSRDEVTDSESGRTVSRYIRLTELVPELLQMVDENTMALRPAVELSYLPQRAQKWVIEQMDIQSCTPSHAQTIRLRQLHEQGQLTEKETAQILAEQKPNQVETIRLPTSKLKAYFPKNYTPRQIEEKILVILEQWRKLERKRAARDAR